MATVYVSDVSRNESNLCADCNETPSVEKQTLCTYCLEHQSIPYMQFLDSLLARVEHLEAKVEELQRETVKEDRLGKD